MSKKQVIEGHFRNSILKLGNVFIDKIQVNPYALTSTQGDFLIQSPNFDIVVECKEVRIKNRKTQPKFYIERFTQEYKLNEFSKRNERNLGFLFLCFWNGRKENSHAYFIPIDIWLMCKKTLSRKTIGIESCDLIFKNWKLNKEWDFSLYL